jgi:predicted nucleotidyltransferase
MSTAVSLANALFSRTQQGVLGLLFGQPQRSFYLKELIGALGMGRGTVQREVSRLVDAGLVTVSAIGNQKHFQANPASPIFDELHGIVIKTFGVADVIRDALEEVAARIKAAFIYGSLAKGSDTAGSDIDVMVITDMLSYSDIVKHLYPLDQKLGRPVNPVVFAMDEFLSKLSTDNAFVSRVTEQPKIMLIGSEDDIPKPR